MKRDYYLRNVCPSVRPSASNNSAPTGRILMKFDIQKFFFSKICIENSGFIKIERELRGTSHEDLYTFVITSR